MDTTALPFSLKEVFRLGNLGLDASLFKQNVLSMESDKYICIRQNAPDGAPQVVIIDVEQNFAMTKKAMSAEAVMMHPKLNVIALRAKKDTSTTTLIQVFDLTSKKKLKDTEITEPIVFWRWINDTKIGLVTQTAVYHVDLQNEHSPPRKVFTREANMSSSQIIGYSVDYEEKWCSLCGIAQATGGGIVGNMQLHFTEASQNQAVQAYISCFVNMQLVDPSYKTKAVVFIERKHTETGMKIHVMEIGKPKEGMTKFRKNGEFSTPPEAAADFPLAIQPSETNGVAFIITKMGYLYIFELSTCSLLFRNRVSETLIFQTVRNTKTDGMLGVNRNGQLLAINMEQEKIVPFIMQKCSHIQDNIGLAFRMAQRFNLPGADNLFVAQFQRLLQAGDYKGAANVARDAPGKLLRNSETIAKLKQLPGQPGQPSPVLVYFSTLLETTKLNEVESLELVRPVIAQGRMNFVENWIKEGKLTFSSELGDLIQPHNSTLALSVYQSSGNNEKVIQGMVETKQFAQIIPYCQKTGFKPNFQDILKRIVPVNPEAAMGFATMLASREGGRQPLIDLNATTDIFVSNGRIQEATGFLLEALKGNRPEEGYLQTRLLEMNLLSATPVAEAIFEMNHFSHFDKPRIAQFCEKAGLYLRALENYTDINDIRRVLLNTHAIDKKQLIEFLARLTPESALVCLNDMMKHNRQNVPIVAEAAVKYNGKIPTPELIKLFDTYGAFDGTYYFLGSILSTTEDPEIYFKYIEAAAKMNNVREVERVIRETTFYEPVKVKEFLMEIKLPDPRPLIYLCDKHGFVVELTKYLFKGGLNKYIEIYLFRVNPDASPQVLGTMIDLDADEIYIKQLLNNIRVCPIDKLTEEFDRRNKLKVLQAWLESRRNEGNQTPELHNALAKIYVDSGNKPEEFLMTNQYYDSKVVGKYCEDRDPHLAFTAYRRAWGSCDKELVELTNKNYLFRLQAKYLVERMDLDLWAFVLKEDNEQRKQVIEQVVQTALPETKNPEEVSLTVKAFMKAELPHELMELLEKIVLHNSDFSKNKNLQNLLLLTAIKADKSRVMDYINRLTNIDGPGLAEIMLEEKHQLYEEAFVLYQKIGLEDKACDVLLQHIENVDRAAEFAHKVNRKDVWAKLGRAQLQQGGYVKEALDSFVRAKDPDMYLMVIGAANQEGLYEELIRFLLMARETLKEQTIDGELIWAYAKTKRLAEIEEFISGSHIADVQKAGDRCYEEGLWEACKLLYTNVGNNAKLASTLVQLGEFQAALEAAKKANTPKTWKEVNMACVRHKEFRLAEQAGMHIIIHPDHLEELIRHYEKYGYSEELIRLLENGLTLERSHMGLYTELGVIYAKYHPERLMDHLQTYVQKVNIPKLLRACNKFKMWPELVFLHVNYDEFDNAIVTMMEHAPTAWKHDLFVKNVTRCSNQDLFYRAIRFYLQWEPMLLNDLLKIISPKLDLPKAVLVLRQTGHLPLVTPFLRSVQGQNVAAVNEALNEIYVENGDYESLRDSVNQNDNFDQIALAQALQKDELLEFRRISALLYRKHKRFQQSIALSKQDELYKDAMETAAESRDPALCEELLRFFVEQRDKENFCAMSYTCYELLHPDVVLELAWRYGYFDFAMPFMIQTLRDLTSGVETVQKKTDDIQKKDQKASEQKMTSPLEIMEMVVPGFMANTPALPPSQPFMPGGGMPGGMPGAGMMPGMGGGMPPPMGGAGGFPPSQPGQW